MLFTRCANSVHAVRKERKVLYADNYLNSSLAFKRVFSGCKMRFILLMTCLSVEFV